MIFLEVTLLSLIWLGIVGEADKGDAGVSMWTHKKFDIGYNKDNIVDVNLTSETKAKLVPDAKIVFTYEVRFKNEVDFHCLTISTLHSELEGCVLN